jgi:FKBP-type peptidyl-prolyl cis-trans isomerase
MGRSTEFYRKNPAARKKHVKKSTEIAARPDQKAKRRELGRKNYAHDKKHGKAARKGKDLSHTKNGLRYKSVKANRGSTSDQKGDRNARGKK